MKRLVSITTWLLLCIMLLSACTPGKANNTPKTTVPSDLAGEATKQDDPVSLDIYYLEDDACSFYIAKTFYAKDVTVNATAFSSLEEMDTRIATEINGNKGPDVILFPSTTSLDTTKMALNGAFLDLSDMLAGDETYNAQNYYSVLDAGNIGGKQLLMPLRFCFPYYCTTQERMTSAGVDLLENYTATQMMSAFHAAASGLDDDYCWMAYDIPMSYGAMIYDPLRLSGVKIADLQNQTLSITEEVFREYSDFAKLTEAEAWKAGSILRNFGTDFTGGRTHIYSMYDNEQFPLDLRYYESLYKKGLNETIEILPIPNYDDPASLTADISLYAAVLQSSDHVETAFKFVRYGMDIALGETGYDLPISRRSVASHLDRLCLSPGKTIKLPNGSVTVSAMSKELRLQCEQTLDRITSGSIRSGVIDDIFTETMEPYIKGEADFEDCFTKFQNQMSLYLYE